jgi:hypothetical protein
LKKLVFEDLQYKAAH